MKYENFEVLGNYSLRDGGNINFFMGKNLELDTEINTYIHELFHMHLTNCSSLGFLLHLFEKECNLALEAQDELHYNKIQDLSAVIFNRTVDVQEIYANNQELLWIEDNISSDIKKKSYELKPKNYQEYCNKMNIITNDKNLNNEEKKYWIDKLCLYSMNIHISSNEFIDALKSKQKLSQYFSRENHPNTRLDKAIEKYTKNDSFDEDAKIRIKDFLTRMKSLGLIKYFDEDLPELDQIATIFKNGDSLDERKLKNFIKLSQKNMDEKVKLFDFYNLKVVRVDNISNYLDYGVFAIKNCENIINKENFYLITEALLESTPTYVSDEAPYNFLYNEKIKVIGISSYEFDLVYMKPSYIDVKDSPVVVLIDSYREAKEIINKILMEGELYIGDLYDKSVNNFSTTLFFRERKEPKIIFIFPTLKKLSLRLIKELGIDDCLVYSSDKHFKKILSIFGDELEMLKFTKWIFSFVMKSSCSFGVIEDPATKMSFDITRSLANDIMEIRIPDYYNLYAALPTKKTVGEPYYSLMEFKNEKNTGNIQTTDQKIIIFFINKNDALNYKKRLLEMYPESNNLEVVGIDRHYWDTVKKHLSKVKINICICLDVEKNIGKLVDLQELDN
ncbi:hypothetical protein P4576_05995 [Peribacillus frigoritolerans]|uniref:hypothetical protein n=1 Tax=Peribacillus frigoritolerans TaxID=450367 RepID=UPI002E1D96A8|nr:hypothetical protein [Peribacillus frigoritolerans]